MPWLHFSFAPLTTSFAMPKTLAALSTAAIRVGEQSPGSRAFTVEG